MHSDNVFAFDARQRFRRPRKRMSIRSIPINDPRGNKTRDCARLAQGNLQVVQTLLPQPLNLFVLERGIANDISQDLHGGANSRRANGGGGR